MEDELRRRSSNRDMIQLEMDVLEREIEEIRKNVYLYECAKQQQAVDESREEFVSVFAFRRCGEGEYYE